MYFKAIINDGTTEISATRNIKDAMMAVTMICHSVYEIKDYSKSDRIVFRKFVEEELAKLAFANNAGLIEEEKRLRENAMAKNAGLRKLLKELGDLLDKVGDKEE